MKRDSPEYKLATTIWVLSCNDLPPQMTYKGIIERTDQQNDSLSKAIVSKFPELFQNRIPLSHLEDWKESMLAGSDRPKWIAASDTPIELINKLESEDVFRNRFRNSIEAPSLSPEILSWGLDYLREHYTVKESTTKAMFQFISSIIVPLISVFAVVFVAAQSHNIEKKRIELDRLRLEREFIIPYFQDFSSALNNSLYMRNANNKPEFIIEQVSKMETSFQGIRPFISDADYDTLSNLLSNYHRKLFDGLIYTDNQEQSNLDISDAYTRLSEDFNSIVKERIITKEE